MQVQAPKAIDSVASIPWKNGGGNTRQLAVAPVGASANDFLWRVSLAQIDASGDFSAFPGIDRTILLWRGDGVTLRSPAWPDQPLSDPRAPFHFRGEEEVVCDLLSGPTQDLNLMVRRGLIDATFEIVSEAEYAVPASDEFILLCASGCAQFASLDGEQAFELEANHFLTASDVEASEVVVNAQGKTLLVAIAIRMLF